MKIQVKFTDGKESFMNIEVHTIITGKTWSEAKEMVQEFLNGSRYIAAQMIDGEHKEVILAE